MRTRRQCRTEVDRFWRDVDEQILDPLRMAGEDPAEIMAQYERDLQAGVSEKQVEAVLKYAASATPE